MFSPKLCNALLFPRTRCLHEQLARKPSQHGIGKLNAQIWSLHKQTRLEPCTEPALAAALPKCRPSGDCLAQRWSVRHDEWTCSNAQSTQRWTLTASHFDNFADRHRRVLSSGDIKSTLQRPSCSHPFKRLRGRWPQRGCLRLTAWGHDLDYRAQGISTNWKLFFE